MRLNRILAETTTPLAGVRLRPLGHHSVLADKGVWGASQGGGAAKPCRTMQERAVDCRTMWHKTDTACSLAVLLLLWSSVTAFALEIEVIDGDSLRIDGVNHRLIGYDAPADDWRAKCVCENMKGTKAMGEPTKADWDILAAFGITPDNLSVAGPLDLSFTAITALPDNLSVSGWLHLRAAAITALPNNLSVGGWLYLGDTGVTALPDNLSVGGRLILRDTGIHSVWVEKERKFDLYVVPHSTDFYVVAGCRFFKSITAAKTHWGGVDYPDANRGKRYIAEIEKAVAALKEAA